MIAAIKNYILKEKNIQVVSVQMGAEAVYHLFEITHHANQIDIAQRVEGLDEANLFAKLNKNKPVLIHVSGKGVLHKKEKKIPDYRSKVIMNVSENDFYFYELFNEKEVFISVVRKTVLDDQLKKFSEKGYLVVDYSIGSIVSSSLRHFVDVPSFKLNDIELFFNDGDLIDLQPSKTTQSVRIADQELSGYELNMFATALHYYLPQHELVYDLDPLQSNRTENTFKRYFNLLGTVGLLFFLSTLVGSYFLLDYYNSKIIETNTSLSLSQDSFSQIQKLEEERTEKRNILNESGVFTNQFLSFYVDRLIQDLPVSITLSELHVFPITKKLKQDEKVEFKSRTITLSGESLSNTAFNQWYKKLKDLPWMSKIDIDKYHANKEDSYDFEIKMIIKE